jgi:Fic family protein
MGRILLNWHLVKRNKAPLLIYTYKDRQTYYRLFDKAERYERLIKNLLDYEKAPDGTYKKAL